MNTPDMKGAIVCYTKCWSCNFGEHDKGWHPWADEEDTEHAKANNLPDPSWQQCGCYCQREHKEKP